MSGCCSSLVPILGSRINSSKCKTLAKMATSRIKLLRNKRVTLVKQMRRDVAKLLESGQEATARIRVEHVIREQNIMAAIEIIELFCQLVVARLPIIAKQRNCPADLKEGVSSLIFAASRCSDIPELVRIRDIFEKRYGEEFTTAATELRPTSDVNQTLIEKLSVRKPAAEVKLKILKEIAKEYQLDWDPTETEQFLKPPDENLEGPRKFVSAVGMWEKNEVSCSNDLSQCAESRGASRTQFKDAASAAMAAAESARTALAAAEVAACMAHHNSKIFQEHKTDLFSRPASATHPSALDPSSFSNRTHLASDESFAQRTKWSSCDPNIRNTANMEHMEHNSHAGYSQRERNTNSAAVDSDIKFDDSDCDEEIIMETPRFGDGFMKQQPLEMAGKDGCECHKSSPSSHVHPRLPDYDNLSARFEALRHQRY